MNCSILFVCTGNICRSPIAAAMLRAGSDGLIDASSAGLLFDDREASDGAIDWAASVDLDLRAHRSRVIDRPMIERAEIILGMEPRHVREVVALVDAAWAKTFTLREFCVRALAVPARSDRESMSRWLERVGDGRRRRDLLTDDPELMIPDPYGCAAGVYEQTARLIERQLVALAQCGWPKGLGAGSS